jgi:hypothetical protein
VLQWIQGAFRGDGAVENLSRRNSYVFKKHSRQGQGCLFSVLGQGPTLGTESGVVGGG